MYGSVKDQPKSEKMTRPSGNVGNVKQNERPFQSQIGKTVKLN